MTTYKRGGKLYLDFVFNKQRQRKATGIKYSRMAKKFFKERADLIYMDMNNIEQISKDYIEYENALTYEKLKKLESINKEQINPCLKSEMDAFFSSILVQRKRTQNWLNSRKKLLSEFFLKENIETIQDFKKEHVLSFITFLKERKLKNSSTKSYFNFLKRFINFCVDEGLRESISLKIPKLSTDESDLNVNLDNALSYEEIKLLISKAISPLKEYLTLAFFTGARTGELLALKIEDIDFKKKEIYIRRTRLSKGECNLPKNKTSFRNIDMLSIVEPTLKKLIEQSKKNKNEFLLPYCAATYDKHFKELLKECDLPAMRLYETRHNFTSLMLSKGEDLEWVSRKMLGHANSYMTYAKYAKYIKKDVKERAKFINKGDF